MRRSEAVLRTLRRLLGPTLGMKYQRCVEEYVTCNIVLRCFTSQLKQHRTLACSLIDVEGITTLILVSRSTDGRRGGRFDVVVVTIIAVPIVLS